MTDRYEGINAYLVVQAGGGKVHDLVYKVPEQCSLALRPAAVTHR
jgi:hypothetical protein